MYLVNNVLENQILAVPLLTFVSYCSDHTVPLLFGEGDHERYLLLRS